MHIGLRLKLLIPPVVILLALLVTGALSFQVIERQSGALDDVQDVAMVKMSKADHLVITILDASGSLHKLLNWLNIGVDDRKVAAAVAGARAHLGAVEAAVAELPNLRRTIEGEAALTENIRALAAAYVKAARDTLDMADTDTVVASAMLASAEAEFEKLELAVQDWRTRFRDSDQERFAEARDDVTVLRTAFIVVFLLALAGAVGVSLMVSSRIVRVIDRITDVMTRLAGGDSSVSLPRSTSRDAIGRMIEAVAVFKDHAAALDRLSRGREREEEERRERLQALLRNLSETLHHEIREAVATASRKGAELKALSGEMRVSITQALSQSETATAESVNASANVGQVAASADDLSSSIGAIAERVGESARFTAAAVDLAQKADQRIAGLTAASERIGDAVRLIGTIARSSNLLALNAFIEAASAGEAGKGFAIVANEVKGLSKQTAEATEEIVRHVQDIRTATAEAVATIAEIGRAIAEVDAIGGKIAEAVNDQTAATSRISTAAMRAASSATQVSDCVSVVGHDTSASAGLADRVALTAEQLTDAIGALDRKLDGILEKARTG